MLTVVSASGAATAEVASTPVTATATVAMRVLSFIWFVPLPFVLGAWRCALLVRQRIGAMARRYQAPKAGSLRDRGVVLFTPRVVRPLTEPGGRPGSASGRRALSRQARAAPRPEGRRTGACRRRGRWGRPSTGTRR